MTARRRSFAHPDHSIRAFRKLSPKLEPWTIHEDDQATRLQAYRQALGKVELASGNNAFVATHGGAALLEYHPQSFEDIGLKIPDLEVVRLTTSTDDGHPRITLGLRSPREAREADRGTETFVFAVDDSFVVRSTPLRITRSESRLGMPVRIRPSRRTPRPTLARHDDGGSSHALHPIGCGGVPVRADPRDRFALEPFLADLKPFEINRKPVVEPAIATFLGWYWMAFVAGGISLAGGSGLALRRRDRDRQPAQADCK